MIRKKSFTKKAKVIFTCGEGEAINLASIIKELFSIRSITDFGRWTKDGFKISSGSDSISVLMFFSE